jgi:hypothetical protein
MNLHGRSYIAFCTYFTKTECSTSFLNQANNETEVRTITRHCIEYLNSYKNKPQASNGNVLVKESCYKKTCPGLGP